MGWAMNRRDFIKSTAALAVASLVPTWLRPPEKPPLNLEAFCGTNGVRFDCTKPFTQEAAGDAFATYATDGKIVVKVAGDWQQPGTHDTKTPPAHRLWWDHDKERGWRPWPKQQWVNENKDAFWHPHCFACKGSGAAGNRVECPKCEGFAEEQIGTNYHSSRIIKCRACNGTGTAPPHCKTCKGSGLIEGGPRHQLVGHAQVSCVYDHLLRKECGEMEYCIIRRPCAVVGKNEKSDLVLFRFAEGTGILVPLTEAK